MGPNSRGGARNKGKPQQHKFSTWVPPHLQKKGGRKNIKRPEGIAFQSRPSSTGTPGGGTETTVSLPSGSVTADTPRISLRAAVLERLIRFVTPDAVEKSPPPSVSMSRTSGPKSSISSKVEATSGPISLPKGPGKDELTGKFKKFLKGFLVLGFEEEHVRAVLERLDDKTHSREDVFLALLRVVVKAYGLTGRRLDPTKDVGASHVSAEDEGTFYTHTTAAEGLSRVDENQALLDELEVLMSMFPDMEQSRGLLLVTPCLTLDVQLGDCDVRFVITQAQCYPSRKSVVYCWALSSGGGHSPAQCRQLSIDTMHFLESLPAGQPVLFEAISYLQEHIPEPEPLLRADADMPLPPPPPRAGARKGVDLSDQSEPQPKKGGGVSGGTMKGAVPTPTAEDTESKKKGRGGKKKDKNKDMDKKPLDIKSNRELALEKAEKDKDTSRNPLDIQEYRDAYLAALNDGLSGQAARSEARKRLKDVLPESTLQEIAHEERKREAALSAAYSFDMTGMGTEINACKRVMTETGLARGKAKGLLTRAKEIMTEEGRDAARDEKSLIELWVGECKAVLRRRLERERKKKEEYLANKSRGPTLRDAYEDAAAAVLGNREKGEATSSSGERDDEAGATHGEGVLAAVPAPTSSAYSVDVCAQTAKEKARQRAEEALSRESGLNDTEREVERQSEKLASELKARRNNKQFTSVLAKRKGLPTFVMRKELVEAVRANAVTVVSGETGCGKTTQLPQLVLDDAIERGEGGLCRMIVTQPRRISAVSVAERIAYERCERVGQSAGYHIRLEKKAGPQTRLLVMTTGILLRRMQLDETLQGISHVFVDEVHERDINTDFLLIVLKGLLKVRPDLKIILMSATLNADLFYNYFAEDGCSAMSIPGRAFPVETLFLEDALTHTGVVVDASSDCFFSGISRDRDGVGGKNARAGEQSRANHIKQLKLDLSGKVSDRVLDTLKNVDESVINVELITALCTHLLTTTDEGAILIFLDGLSSIRDVVESLQAARLSDVQIFPLHSSLSSAEQSRVFRTMPAGKRKIVVSTNIAETSVTIEDVVFVIDSCRMKENRYDEDLQMQVLEDVWIAQANARQRRGRAGRVRSGICYHLVSSTTMNTLPKSGVPEMLRLNHEELILHILALGMGDPYHILASALSPPEHKAITNALIYLDKIDAVYLDTSAGTGNWTSHITPLGFHLATIPVAPKIGKILLLGCMYKTIDPVLTVAASLSAKNIFVTSFTDRELADEAKLAFLSNDSDLLTTVEAFRSWQAVRDEAGGDRREGKLHGRATREEDSFCRENFLSLSGLQLINSMRLQYINLLQDIGFLPMGVNLRSVSQCDENRYGSSIALVKAVLAAGMSPNICCVGPGKLTGKSPLQDVTLQTRKKTQGMYVHPSSVNAQRSIKAPDGLHVMYMECVKTSKIYARDVTVVTPLLLAIFGGRLQVNEKLKVVTVDGWVVFKCETKLANALMGLQQELQDSFTKRVIDPTADVEDRWDALVSLVNDVLRTT